MNTQTTNENPLGTQPVKKLLMQFAIPSIVAMLVSSLYNIVDQFFIGRNVGELGNAATNISFPLSISCIAIALLFGIGGASAFNLAMGKGEKEKAVYYIGNSAVMLFGCGVILTTITLLFLEPLLRFFIDAPSADALNSGRLFMRIVSPFYFIVSMKLVADGILRGMGQMKQFMVSTFTDLILRVVLAALLSATFLGYTGIWCAWPVGWCVSTCISVFFTARLLNREIFEQGY